MFRIRGRRENSVILDVKSTKEVVIESAKIYTKEEIIKRDRLEALTEMKVLPFPLDVCADLWAANFVWWTDTSFVAKFTFAASVKTGGIVCHPVYNHGRHNVIYTGDIPTTALRRLDAIEQIGFKWITVHSNEPLPVKVVAIRELTKLDPVIVAWKSNPQIYSDRGESEAQQNTWGVIVAIWDADREIVF